MTLVPDPWGCGERADPALRGKENVRSTMSHVESERQKPKGRQAKRRATGKGKTGRVNARNAFITPRYS